MADNQKIVGKTIVQPSVRSGTTWSPALIKTALLQADSGQFRTLADLCDWVLADDRVHAVAQTFVGGVLSLPLTFEPSGDGRRRGRAVKALEADEDFWRIAPEDEMFQIYAWALLLGFQWAHLEHVQEKSGRVLPCLRFWHTRNVRFDWTTRKWFTRVDEGLAEVEMVDGDGEWVMFSPYGRFRPWAHGLWRGQARWVLLKSYAEDDWGRHSEKASILAVETPQGVSITADQRKELANDLYAIGRNAVFAPPAGVKVSLLEAKANTRDIYLAQVEAANTAVAVGWLGQNLTTEVKEGSFAAAQVHGRVEGQRIRGFCEFEATTLREKVLTRWAELNFGNRDLAPWPVRDTELPEDGKLVAEIAKLRADSFTAMKTAGVTIDAEAWFIRGEIEIVEVKEPEPPAPPTVPGQNPAEQNPDEANPDDQAEPEDDSEEPADGKAKPDEKGKPKPKPKPEKGKAKPKPDDEKGKPEKKPAKKKALASGFDLQNATGFVEGQTYTDTLADRGAERGAEALEGFLNGLLDVIDGIESLDDARAKVRDYYRDALAPEELADKAEKLFVMAQLGGQLAVRQDIPELKDDDGRTD